MNIRILFWYTLRFTAGYYFPKALLFFQQKEATRAKVDCKLVQVNFHKLQRKFDLWNWQLIKNFQKHLMNFAGKFLLAHRILCQLTSNNFWFLQNFLSDSLYLLIRSCIWRHWKIRRFQIRVKCINLRTFQFVMMLNLRSQL